MYKFIGTSYVHLGINIDENKCNDRIDKCFLRTLLIKKWVQNL